MPLLGQGSGVIWLWLVLASVSGWLVLQSRFFRHRMWPVAGYNRYFLILLAGILTAAAIIGAAATTVAAFRILSFDWGLKLTEALAEIWKLPLDNNSEEALGKPSDSMRLALFWSAPAILVAGLAVQFFSLSVSKEKIAKRRLTYLTKINGIQGFVEEAGKQAGLVTLTLSNRKVYVGWPEYLSDADNPRPPNQHLYFSPVFSGYRKEDTLEMEITNDYERFLYDDLLEEWEMVIPVNEIVHVQPFDPDVHDEMQRAKRARKRRPRKK